MTCSLVLYVCLGTPSGYVSARIYKSESAIMALTTALGSLGRVPSPAPAAAAVLLLLQKLPEDVIAV